MLWKSLTPKVADKIKRINGAYAVYTLLFCFMIVCSRHTINMPSSISNLESTYITDFSMVDVFAFILIVPFVYIILLLLSELLQFTSTHFFHHKRESKAVFIMLPFLFVFIWIPYLMSYWPGGVYSDTLDSINMALGKASLDNHNPILYSLIWKMMFQVTGVFSGTSEYNGLKLFTIVQVVLIALVMSGFIFWCYKKGLAKHFIILLTLVVAIFPLYPFYGISLWKDTIFSIVIFVYSLFLFQLFSKYTNDLSFKKLVTYILFNLLIIFLRNNGIYISIFCSILTVLLCMKSRKKMSIKMGIASLFIIIFSMVIQGPIYNQLGYNIDKTRESMGIPLQQVAYIVATDGNLSCDEMEFLDEIMPLDNWKSLYDPIVVDTIKFDPSFDNEYFEQNINQFIRVYTHMIIKNPVKAIKAYLLETMGFWDINQSSSIAYICNFSFDNTGYCMSDYFDYYFGISFRNFIEPRKYISSAIFVWIMLFAVTVCFKKRYFAGMISILPTLGLWLSIMIATPIAFSFRYVYALFLMLPLYFIIMVSAYKHTT